jgi:hypothetical protein
MKVRIELVGRRLREANILESEIDKSRIIDPCEYTCDQCSYIFPLISSDGPILITMRRAQDSKSSTDQKKATQPLFGFEWTFEPRRNSAVVAKPWVAWKAGISPGAFASVHRWRHHSIWDFAREIIAKISQDSIPKVALFRCIYFILGEKCEALKQRPRTSMAERCGNLGDM